MEERLETIPEASSGMCIQLSKGGRSLPLKRRQKTSLGTLEGFSARLSNILGSRAKRR